MQSDRHARIKDRAYQLWVAEGRVHGKHDEHWRRAEREIAEQEAKSAGATPQPTRAKAKAAIPSAATPKGGNRTRVKPESAAGNQKPSTPRHRQATSTKPSP